MPHDELLRFGRLTNPDKPHRLFRVRLVTTLVIWFRAVFLAALANHVSLVEVIVTYFVPFSVFFAEVANKHAVVVRAVHGQIIPRLVIDLKTFRNR